MNKFWNISLTNCKLDCFMIAARANLFRALTANVPYTEMAIFVIKDRKVFN
jgi:hypothetical protein